MGIRNGKATNVNSVHDESLLPIDKYHQIPIVSLEQAVEPLISLLPTVQTYVQMVKEKCLNPGDGLTSDESASIMLYTIIWQPFDQCLYVILNSTLPKLDENQILQPWILYLKLLFTALLHLPSSRLTVYRGSKSDLGKQYQIDDIILWSDLPLCTTSIDYLQSDKCLGQTGKRTIFKIECNTVKNIHKHCYFPLNYFVLFLPATKFQVVGQHYYDNDTLHLVTLQEIESSFLLHSINQMKTNLDTQTSMNIFRRFWLSFKKSGNQSPVCTDSYRNISLEHRIAECEHSWTVDLDRQNLTDRDMKIVLKWAIMKNHCKRVRLRDNNITCQGGSILAEGLYNNTTLESLDLRNNHISDLGVQCLALAIIYSNIKTLNLESNEITAEGAQYLAQMLKENRTITELYLSKNHLGDQGVELLAKALTNDIINLPGQSDKEICLSNQSTLQHLYLGQNDITDEGLKHLSDMLKTNRTLTWLWLTGNEISNHGVEFLSNILADYNMTIEWLFLNSNKFITDASIDALLNMLKRNNTLKTLYLNNCNLSDVTKRKLLKMMKTKKDFDLEV